MDIDQEELVIQALDLRMGRWGWFRASPTNGNGAGRSDASHQRARGAARLGEEFRDEGQCLGVLPRFQEKGRQPDLDALAQESALLGPAPLDLLVAQLHLQLRRPGDLSQRVDDDSDQLRAGGGHLKARVDGCASENVLCTDGRHPIARDLEWSPCTRLGGLGFGDGAEQGPELHEQRLHRLRIAVLRKLVHQRRYRLLLSLDRLDRVELALRARARGS